MLNKFSLAMVLAAACSLPAWAQGACTAPVPPVALDPAKATVDQMRSLLTASNGFIAASDTYQQCLAKEVADRKAAATADKPFDPAIEKADMALVLSNQKAKEKVGADFSTIITAFKKVHGCENKQLAQCQG